MEMVHVAEHGSHETNFETAQIRIHACRLFERVRRLSKCQASTDALNYRECSQRTFHPHKTRLTYARSNPAVVSTPGGRSSTSAHHSCNYGWQAAGRPRLA